ncbi:MAG TPA: GTPase ObgE [Candidatus Saccharimonadales bacterium]|nr:GTPase ObgE [Candidatus Saccharimonadales bacterium]
MFADNVEIKVKAGKGGDGRTSFLHEKYRAKGGPDGGDGGHGGDIIFLVDHNLNTLASFRNHKSLAASDGEMGGKNKAHGKSAEDITIKVPVGTMVYVGDKQIADLAEDGQSQVMAQGGRGGFGNAHFVSSTRQSPRVAELGEAGEEMQLRLELKLVADVGLIGLPNAGKSTLLSVISNARPEIADYAFTTLVPNLGVVAIDDDSFVAADIPGLIEGASLGKGLGDEFLRHIERTSILLHLIDAHSQDVVTNYRLIQQELKSYGHDLINKEQIVVLTKIDGLEPAKVKLIVAQLKKATKRPVYAISAPAHKGLAELLRAVAEILRQHRSQPESETPFVYDLSNTKLPEAAWEIEKLDSGWRISGQKPERFAKRTDFANPDSLARLRDILTKLGIVKKLEQKGLKAGDRVEVAGKDLIW